MKYNLPDSPRQDLKPDDIVSIRPINGQHVTTVTIQIGTSEPIKVTVHEENT